MTPLEYINTILPTPSDGEYYQLTKDELAGIVEKYTMSVLRRTSERVRARRKQIAAANAKINQLEAENERLKDRINETMAILTSQLANEYRVAGAIEALEGLGE